MSALASPAVRASIHIAWLAFHAAAAITLAYALPDVPSDIWVLWMAFFSALASVVMAFAASKTTVPAPAS